MKEKSKAILAHMFGDHTFCGSWCQAKGKTQQEIQEKKLVFWDRVNNEKDKAIYKDLSEVIHPYLTDEALSDISHIFSTNKCEALNSVISHFLPKNKYLQGSMAAYRRVCLAATIDSIGYGKTVDNLMSSLGMDLNYCAALCLQK